MTVLPLVGIVARKRCFAESLPAWGTPATIWGFIPLPRWDIRRATRFTRRRRPVAKAGGYHDLPPFWTSPARRRGRAGSDPGRPRRDLRPGGARRPDGDAAGIDRLPAGAHRVGRSRLARNLADQRRRRAAGQPARAVRQPLLEDRRGTRGRAGPRRAARAGLRTRGT